MSYFWGPNRAEFQKKIASLINEGGTPSEIAERVADHVYERDVLFDKYLNVSDDNFPARQRIFLTKIADYVSADMHVKNHGGWTPVSNEDLSIFWGLCQELRDLHFDRDEDGDPTIQFDMVSRLNGRAINVHVPYGIVPSSRRDEGMTLQERYDRAVENRRAMFAAIRHLTSAASDLTRTLDDDCKELDQLQIKLGVYNTLMAAFNDVLISGEEPAAAIDALGDYVSDVEREGLLARIREKYEADITPHEKAIAILIEAKNEPGAKTAIINGQRRWGFGIHGDLVRKLNALRRELKAASTT